MRVRAAAFREDREALADRNTRGEADVGRVRLGVSAERAHAPEVGVSHFDAEDAVEVAAEVRLPPRVLGVAFEAACAIGAEVRLAAARADVPGPAILPGHVPIG